MSETTGIDYGPLAELLGTWEGDKGMDVAPEPDGAENNPFYETIIFTPVEDDVENAEQQELVAVHYRQVVRRKSDNKVFHDETGYWMWDATAGVVMHSLAIPRAVSLLAGGSYSGEKDEDGRLVLEVSARHGSADWQIIESPFMRDNASTREFRHRVVVGDGRLSYSETTMVDIYGKVFEHTDSNELVRK